MAWMHPALSFVNHPADYQRTNKGRMTNGVSLFLTSERQLIMVALVRKV